LTTSSTTSEEDENSTAEAEGSWINQKPPPTKKKSSTTVVVGGKKVHQIVLTKDKNSNPKFSQVDEDDEEGLSGEGDFSGNAISFGSGDTCYDGDDEHDASSNSPKHLKAAAGPSPPLQPAAAPKVAPKVATKVATKVAPKVASKAAAKVDLGYMGRPDPKVTFRETKMTVTHMPEMKMTPSAIYQCEICDKTLKGWKCTILDHLNKMHFEGTEIDRQTREYYFNNVDAMIIRHSKYVEPESKY